MRTDLFFYPAIAAAVLSSCGGKKDAAEVNKKPNVLFIYADDIGYDKGYHLPFLSCLFML